MKELGARLKKIREEKGISLEDLQEMTKIRKSYLVAIEEGNESVLPGEVYLKGFLKSYAQAIGMNPQEVMADYEKLQGSDLEEEREALEEMLRNGEPRFKPFTIHLIIILAIVAIILFSIFNILRLNPGDESPTPPPATEEQEEMPDREQEDPLTQEEREILDMDLESFFLPYLRNEPLILLEDAARGGSQPVGVDTVETQEEGIQLQMLAVERSWIRVTVDGVNMFQGFLEEGDQQRFTGEQEIAIRVGNAGGILLQDGEGEYSIPLGERGEVADLLFNVNGKH